MKILPPTRTQDIVMQDLGQEILLYDLTVDKAFCLNESAAAVYRRCDGITSLADFKRTRNVPDEAIYLTLDILADNDLLENRDYRSPLGGLSRREVVRRAGVLGALTLMPVISTVVAPFPAMAASGGASCPGKLSSGAPTPYHCNFGPRFAGSAEFCDEIECSVDGSGALCCSGSTHAVLDPTGGTNFYRCVCD